MKQEKEESRRTFGFSYEEVDNGCLVRGDESVEIVEVAKFGDGGDRYREIAGLVGRVVFSEINGFCNEEVTNKVKVTVTIEDGTPSGIRQEEG